MSKKDLIKALIEIEENSPGDDEARYFEKSKVVLKYLNEDYSLGGKRK